MSHCGMFNLNFPLGLYIISSLKLSFNLWNFKEKNCPEFGFFLHRSFFLNQRDEWFNKQKYILNNFFL